MLRSVITRGITAARCAATVNAYKHIPVVSGLQCRFKSGGVPADPAAHLENLLIETLRSKETTGYELRAILNQMQGEDYIPGPKAIEEMMLACRRVNDYALAVRTLEAIANKCCAEKGLFDQLIAPVKPTLDKLGILTPAQMGYDKPEMYLKSAFDIH